MNDIRLHLDKRPWLDFGWLRGVFGGITAGGLCILLVSLYFAYRQGRIEQATVADILSISPGGAADEDDRPRCRTYLYEILGIPRPVTGLFLKGNQIKDRDLAKLASFSNLESLSIDDCPISEEGVKEIAKLPTLRSLSLFGCDDITDESLTYLGTMKSLTSLSICSFRGEISSHNIYSLSALPNLDILDLSYCPGISDESVEPLALLSHLVNLDIRGTSISKGGANRLQRALPNTIVLADY